MNTNDINSSNQQVFDKPFFDKSQQFKLEVNKTYSTIDNESVKIISYDPSVIHPYAFIAIIDNEIVEMYNCEGKSLSADYDIYFEDFSTFKIDDKVWVRDDDSHKEVWLKRHFACVSDTGKPMTFDAGRTSWTHKDGINLSKWDFCKKFYEHTD